MYSLALFYQEHEAMQQALDMYKQILDIKPDHADALHNVGDSNYEYKQDYDVAIECFTSAIKADSTFWQAYANRARAWQKKGETAKAQADFAASERLKNQ